MSPSVTSPRLVIGAPQGRSGKTTLSLGLCAAFAGQGLSVQPFKKGPDYIDPSWLSEAAGRACFSLDPFFLSAQNLEPAVALRRAFWRGVQGADLAIIEGNHGLYDSSLQDGSDEDGLGSTAAVARALKAPILLVINAARMGRSIAALLQGYQNFEVDTPIAGVILNNVAHGRHEEKLRQAVERYCSLPVLGALPRRENLTIPDRHLGLVPRGEQEGLLPALQACKQAAERYLDLPGVLQIARAAPALEMDMLQSTPAAAGQARIGVLRDRAFSFYYPENLQALEQAGAQLEFIDAFSAQRLPGVDGLVIGGGFPELFLDELNANRSLQSSIHQAVQNGLPVYAECGGLMYLSQAIRWRERRVEMAGVLPCEVVMLDRPQGHGYVEATTNGVDPFFPAGTHLRGHEFHHSQVVGLIQEHRKAYKLLRGNGIGDGADGLVVNNVLAAYTHLHADGSPEWAPALVRKAIAYRGTA